MWNNILAAFIITFITSSQLDVIQNDIKLMGNDRWDIREQASARLFESLKANPEAVLPLLEVEVKQTDDAEIKSRCKTLINDYWLDFYDVRDDNGYLPDVWNITHDDISWIKSHLIKCKSPESEFRNTIHSEATENHLVKMYYLELAYYRLQQRFYTAEASRLGLVIMIKDLRDTGVSKEKIKEILSRALVD